MFTITYTIALIQQRRHGVVTAKNFRIHIAPTYSQISNIETGHKYNQYSKYAFIKDMLLSLFSVTHQ